MANTLHSSGSKCMVPFFGINTKNKLHLDQLGLSLLRGLHVCFVSFECLTQAKQSTRLQLKLEAPNTHNPNTTLPPAALAGAAWAHSARPAAPVHTCNHQRNTLLLQILHQSKQKCACGIGNHWSLMDGAASTQKMLEEPSKNPIAGSQKLVPNDIEGQIRHVSPPRISTPKHKASSGSTCSMSNMHHVCSLRTDTTLLGGEKHVTKEMGSLICGFRQQNREKRPNCLSEAGHLVHSFTSASDGLLLKLFSCATGPHAEQRGMLLAWLCISVCRLVRRGHLQVSWSSFLARACNLLPVCWKLVSVRDCRVQDHQLATEDCVAKKVLTHDYCSFGRLAPSIYKWSGNPFRVRFFNPKSGPPPTFNFDVFDDAFFESFRMPALCLGCPTFSLLAQSIWWPAKQQSCVSTFSTKEVLDEGSGFARILAPFWGSEGGSSFKEDTNSCLKLVISSPWF